MTPSYRYAFILGYFHDADTLTVDVDLGFHTWLRKVKLRLAGINAPELATPEGMDALKFVQTLAVAGQQGVAEIHGPDKYGNRWDATVWFADGASVNEQLIASGHAKVFP